MGEKLRDVETGNLALNLDPRGRLHAEATVDQAVALSYLPFDMKLASSVVRRLLENDFETGHGPRTVSRSNNLYYSPDYGEGQLGGCWTRGTLAHALLCYASGQAALGSAQLEKVAALVSSECEKMGGVAGEFPYWFDPERRQMGSVGSDPVAASRFVEVLLAGEAGMKCSLDRASFRVPDESRLRWLLVRNLGLGGGGSLFVGRSQSRTFIVSSLEKAEVHGSTRLQGSDTLESTQPMKCVAFWDPASILVCLGNASDSPCVEILRVPVRGKPIATALFVDVDEFEIQTGSGRGSTGESFSTGWSSARNWVPTRGRRSGSGRLPQGLR